MYSFALGKFELFNFGCIRIFRQIIYQVYRKVEVDDKELDVINFSSAYQYVPIGQCV